LNYHRFRAAPPAANPDPLDGMLVVDKPTGPTSHDIVNAVRRTFQIEKVGHGGTLDPMATGVLILLLGRATKMSEQLIGADKEYEGTMRLGIATDSHDADGEVVREADPGGVTEDGLRGEMKKLTGDLWQMPPMVSAVKVNGKPLYKSARKGLEVERKARLIHVYEFRLLAFRPGEADFRVRCTKGTYIRKLAADVGDGLGCGAHLSRLRRTACGETRVETALPLDEILKMDRDTLTRRVIPMRLWAKKHEDTQ